MENCFEKKKTIYTERWKFAVCLVYTIRIFNIVIIIIIMMLLVYVAVIKQIRMYSTDNRIHSTDTDAVLHARLMKII